MERYEAAQVDAPGFSYAAEIEMWPKYLAAAQELLRRGAPGPDEPSSPAS